MPRKPILFVDGKKPCSTCKEMKTEDYFGVQRSNPSGRSIYCHDCYSRKYKAEYARNRDKYIAAQKKYLETEKGARNSFAGHLRRKYGITHQQYEYMFRKQSGACAICGGNNLNGRRLCVDHNHKTGQVRGLLCDPCNYAVGAIKEDFNILESMHDYLELWGRIGQATAK